jgi:isoleucyl-tRNA synthetase
MKYNEPKQLNMPAIEQEILQFWKANDIFAKSIENRDGADDFVFYEGPPSANGLPGIHHVMSRAIKDIFCRYKTLSGYRVERRAGWDTHGLPIELGVEKELGIRKDDIGNKNSPKYISIEDYNAKCREAVMRYTGIWNDLTVKMGYWVDMENPYVTYKNEYIESVWWLLKQIYDKSLLYKGFTIQPYSPAAGTGLSSHELNQPGTYRDIKDTTITAQFKVKVEVEVEVEGNTVLKGIEGDTYFIAWTTTPWTLPSNTALAVGKNITYAVVKTFNQYTFQPMNVILARDLISKQFNEKAADITLEDYKPGDKLIPYKIIGEFRGEQLEGIAYEQLMPYAQPTDGEAFKVVIGDFVTIEDGTGIVHIAPSFGSDDFRVAKQKGLGSLTLVDKRGRFLPEVTDFANEFVKEQYLSEEEKNVELEKQKVIWKDTIKNLDKYLSVDERIALMLKIENKAFKIEKYEHSYPHCWRTDKPILYYPLDSWFIKTTAAKDRLIELNKTINWKPESTGTGRFGNWLENLQDWNLSRSRFWGIPLPIWRTADGTEEKCIGSIAHLNEEIAKAETFGIKNSSYKHDEVLDLHRPYIDNIILASESGKPMTRELDLIDVWFDSGAMPYAQDHYMGEGKPKNFPADFIAEGVDQTRGWFFTLHAIATLVFDSVAFKNVVSNGLVLDKNGQKMSKRLGNAADPFDTIAKYSADASRWYMIGNAAPWDNLKFDIDGIKEVQRKYFGTLYNTYSFFAMYANVDQWSREDNKTIPYENLAELDRWIISKLNTLIKEVTECYETYEPHRAVRMLETFVDRHLSNWYVRLSRRRFWKGDLSDDKYGAFETLHHCLQTISQLMSPVSPFFAEWLYCSLTKESESVHLTDLVKADFSKIDSDLEQRMDMAQDICSMVLGIRKKENIKVRIPLQKIQIPVIDEAFKQNIKAVEDLIKSEVNVKEVELVNEGDVKIIKNLKLNFKTLGKKFGKHMKAIQTYVAENQEEVIRSLEEDQQFALKIGEEDVVLLLEDVEIIPIDIPGWKVANEGNITVALDIIITPELKEEGTAREIVNRIQNIRKEQGFTVTDKITVNILENEYLKTVVNKYYLYIRSEILATQINFSDEIKTEDSVEIEEIATKIQVSKI